MNTKKFFMLLAAVLLGSVSAFAQKYYWYAGQVKPSSMSSDPTTSDEYLCNNWFELGEEMPSEIYKLIKGGTQDGGAWYVAVPYANNQTYYPSTSVPNIIDSSVPWTDEYIEVNGILYHIFEYGGSTGTRCCPILQKFDENLFIVIPPLYVIKYGDEIPDLSEHSYRVINTAGKTLNSPLVLTTEATKLSPVGGYEIFVDMSSIEKNVLFYYTPWINIRRAPLMVGVHNVTIAEGDPIPTFTLIYEGWRNDDTEDSAFITKPTASTSATSDSEAGTYVITVSGGETYNYSLNYVNGTLTIEGNDPNRINSLQQERLSEDVIQILSLSGQRLNKMQRGINIKDGRKILK